MANINMKRVVADAIANHLATNITGLAGKVSSVIAGPETMAPCLAVKVLADQVSFESHQGDEVYQKDPDDGKLVLDVGAFTGLVSIELYAVSPAERELYEQRILDLFIADVWAPGTLFITTPNLTIAGYVSLYPAQIKVRLSTEEWNDEFAFEGKRYSFLEVSIDYPALTSATVANLVSLQVCLSDVNAVIVDIDDIDADLRVEVLEDGTTIKGTL